MKKSNKMNVKLKDRLKELRQSQGLSQGEFADKIGATRTSVFNWENEKTPPDLYWLLQICERFDCDLDYLTGRIDEKTHGKTYICNQLGLPEAVVDKLIGWKRWSFLREPLTSLLNSDAFLDLLQAYHSYMLLVEGLKEKESYSSGFRTRTDGKIIISREEAIQHFKGQVAGILSGILEKMYQEKAKKLPKAENEEWTIEAEIEATKNDLKKLEQELKEDEKEQRELREEYFHDQE